MEIVPFSKYCTESEHCIIAEQNIATFDWPKQQYVEDTYRLASVPEGITNGWFHLIDPSSGSYIVDQQNIRFAKPFPAWSLQDSQLDLDSVNLKRIEGTALVIGGMKNHWHFLINFLPRLIMADRFLNSDFSSISHVVIHEPTGAQSQLLQTMYPDLNFLPISNKSDFGYQFDNILYPHLPRNVHFSSELLGLTRTALTKFITPSGKEPNRIFVDRNPETPRRRLYDREQMLGVLNKHKVTSVFNEQFSLTEQISIFKNARLVVGLHGAGLANLMFCTSGTPVVIIDYKWPSEMNSLAKVLGLKPITLLAEQMPIEGVTDRRLWDLKIQSRQLTATLENATNLISD
ncbi:MAG: hypothetical protein CMK09_06480 [Ponticaulis sp.]|nr:hypothetical protein [Ponticaulis sp.]